MVIIWCMIPETWHTTDRIFCHFGLFFAFSPLYQPEKTKFWKNEINAWRHYDFTHFHLKWKSYDVWFLRYGVCLTEFFFILHKFLHLYPTNSLKNQNFEKMKKLAISFYTCVPQMTIIWCMVSKIWSKTYRIFLIWNYFLPFHPPTTTPQNRNFEKWKKRLEISSFTKGYRKSWPYAILFLRYGTWLI